MLGLQNSLGVQLGKRMLSKALNEGVSIVALGLPSWVILVLLASDMVKYHAFFRGNHHRVGSLPLLEIFELGPKFFQDQAGPPTQCYLTSTISGAHAVLGAENKCTICEGERPKKENGAITYKEKWCMGVYGSKKCVYVCTTILPIF